MVTLIVEPRMMAVSDLKGAPYNPRRRDKDPKFKQLVASVEKFGILSPLEVTRDGRVINGHRRLEAAKRCGLVQVPVTVLDGDPAVLFSEMNGTMRPMSPAESAEAYLLSGGRVIPKSKDIQRDIAAIEAAFGRTGLEKLVASEASPRHIRAVHACAAYCERDDDAAFKKKLFHWLLGRKMTYRLRRAMEDQVPAQAIIDAVENDVDIVSQRIWSTL